MNTKFENKQSMYLSVVGVCDGNPTAWQGLKAFAQNYATFKEHVGNIQDLAPKQGNKPTGHTKDKARLREEMADLAHEIGSAVHSYALLQPSGDLAAKVDFARSELTAGRDSTSADRCQSICDAAKSVVDELGDYDITAADVKALAEAIKAYRAVISKPREARIAGKSATAQLAVEFDAADEILNEHLDAFLPKLRKSAPEFASLYEGARVIVDNTASRRGKTAPTPANP
jgi:hypothetical protein